MIGYTTGALAAVVAAGAFIVHEVRPAPETHPPLAPASAYLPRTLTHASRPAVRTTVPDQSSVQAQSSVQPLSDPDGNWKLVPSLSDEFNEKTLNASKWTTVTPDFKPAWTWSSDAVRVGGGNLQITAAYDQSAGGPIPYTSGIARSLSTQLYGYFEARLRAAPRFPGLASAFWASPTDKHEQHTEIDFVETTQHMMAPRRIDTNTHVFDLDGVASKDHPIHEQRGWAAPFDPRDDFHVYGCEWTPDRITWFIDGHKVAERANDYWHQPLNVSISLGLRRPLTIMPASDGFPATMVVDYVRVWTH